MKNMIRTYFPILMIATMGLFTISSNVAFATDTIPAGISVVKPATQGVIPVKSSVVAVNPTNPATPNDNKTNTTNTPVSTLVTTAQPVATNQAAPVVVQQPDAVLAKVLNVQPVYATRLVPHRVCRIELHTMVVPIHRAVDGSGALVGGLAGGVIGHGIGGGTGNVIATIGGAVLGGLMGNGVEQEMNRPYMERVWVKVCRTKKMKESFIKGYSVTYLVNGAPKTTFMKDKPTSDQIRLELSPVVNS